MLKHGQVRLRTLEPTDVERVMKWINDAEVCRWLLRRQPVARRPEIEWLESAGTDSRSMTPANIVLAIEVEQHKDGGVWLHVGSIGLHGIDWKNRQCELGIMIGEKQLWGKGIGRDAITALLGHAFGELGLHRVQLGAFAGNTHAVRCYTACGFVVEGTLREKFFRDGQWHDELVMSVLDRDWFARQQQQH